MSKNKPESSKSSQVDPLDLGDYEPKKTLMQLLAEDPQGMAGLEPFALLEAESQRESLDDQQVH
jgi:hypothetical protein